MAKIYTTIVEPRDDPFTAEVENFWDIEGQTVSASARGIDKWEGSECVIGNCDYNIPAYLDHCHIIQKMDTDMVRSLFLIYVFG